MSINHLGNSFSSLPLSSGNARLRPQSTELSTTVAEQKAPESNHRRMHGDIVSADDAIQHRNTKTTATDSVFRPIPSFDELPASLRNALQSYLTIEQVAEPVSQGGSELLVSIDTFV